MHTPQWRHPATLIGRLIEQPQQFHFFQAVRIIDLWLGREKGGRDYALEHVLRCKNSVSLRFPCSQIEHLEIESVVGQLHHVHLTPSFMGLLGVHGLLPHCYTETIAAQIHFTKNDSGRAFFDIFTHRSMILFYRAWEKSHLEFRHAPQGVGNGDLLRLQTALAIASPSMPAVASLPAEILGRYAALIRHRPVAAATIIRVLSDYFNLPFHLEPFVAAWIPLAEQQRSQLGLQNCGLGQNTLLGSSYRRRDLVVRLRIGPLARAQAESFLAPGRNYQALRAVLALFAVPNLRYEVHPVLRAEDVCPIRLDASAALGRSAFLLSKQSPGDRDDMHYHLNF